VISNSPDDFCGIRLAANDQVWAPTYYARTFLEILSGYNLAGSTVLDFGCGSGVLAIACAKAGARVVGSDINPHAVKLAKLNARLNDVRVEFLQSDRFRGLENFKGSVDLIVANTPSLPGRAAEVVDRENADAYNENGDGRELLDVVIREGVMWCKPGGMLLSCTNSEQNFKLSHELLRQHWSEISTVGVKEFEFDLPMLARYRDEWLSRGALFERGGLIFHKVEFFAARK
jgi:methylase of polypeptide subunit release factors